MADAPIKTVCVLPASKKPWKMIAMGDRIVMSNPEHPAVFLNVKGVNEIDIIDDEPRKF